METADLDLSLPSPAISPEDVEKLLLVLRSSERICAAVLLSERDQQRLKRGWLTAREIAVEMFGFETETAQRRVRAIASAARPAVVSFPGSLGYNLWERCTLEEINHGIESLESQGKDMIRQANVYRVAYHRRFRGARPADQPATMFPASA